MDDILASLCTPGGITEAGLRHIEAEGVPEAWAGACDLVLRKLRGQARGGCKPLAMRRFFPPALPSR